MATKKLGIDFWKDQVKICRDYMKPRHKRWRDLLNRYNLDFSSDSVDKQFIIRKSSMYPIARQVRASVAFNHPRFTATTDDPDFVRSGELLTKAANKAIRLMRVKREIQQQSFDTLFCSIGWGKYTYNPQGLNAEPPYVSNDEFQEDFVAYTRVNPFYMFVDPLTPPHRLGDARFVIERLFVPMEFLEEDDRFNKRAVGKLKAVDYNGEDDFLTSLEEASSDDDSEDNRQIGRAMTDGKMAELWEISDRIHGKRIVLSMDIDTLLEEEPHPFLKVAPIFERDQFGQVYETGYEPSGGYLVKGGFAYSPLKIDTQTEGYYPEPSMEYIKDLEQMQVDGLTRRQDLTKRFSRVVLANESELSANPSLATQLRDSRDGDVIKVLDVNAFQQVPWGEPPQDQLNLQGEARSAEEEVLRVSEMAGVGRRTATEASFAASAGAINREWIKEQVAQLYVDIGTNVLRIFGDPRYTPEEFIVRAVADEGGPEEAMIVLEQSHFLTNFHLEVDAESIQPLAAQRERDNIIALVDRLMPHTDMVDKKHLLEMLASAHGVRNTEALFTIIGNPVQNKLLGMENQQLAQGADPGVLPEEDHLTHVQAHQQGVQEALQQIQLPQGATPQMVQQQQNVIQQVFEQHIAAHQQYLGQAASALVNGGSPAAPAAETPQSNDIVSQVRSNAQLVSNEAQEQADNLMNQ